MDALLAPDEGPAVEVREGRGSFVVACEHASNRMPRLLGTLGLSLAHFERHIAWDPGAAELSIGISANLAGDLVLQRFSRLVVDCNRDPGNADAITPFSEDTEIPGNVRIAAEAKASRVHALWAPFHVGIISTAERTFAEAMLAVLRRDKSLVVGDNQPYSSKDNVDYTIRRHGRDRGLPHVMIEVRNDLLRTVKDIAAWTERLTEALRESADAVGLSPIQAVAWKQGA
jgi:predicted N-formylglutamate amidohydrolase